MISARSPLPQLCEWQSEEGLTALQNRQLEQTVAWAARSPLYQATLAAGSPHDIEELASLPLTSRADLRENYPFGLLAVPRSRLATYHESRDEQGRRTPSFYTHEDWRDLAERFARKWIGLLPSDVVMIPETHSTHLYAEMARVAGRLSRATVVTNGTVDPISGAVRLLHDLEVTLTWSTPSYSLRLAAAARAAGYRPARDFPALRGVLVGGERLDQQRRCQIQETWEVPVVEDHMVNEIGTLASECSEGRMHIWADRVIPEVYDPASGASSFRGTGQLVLTTLYCEAMPLVRYNVEEFVEVAYPDCGCGWSLPTVEATELPHGHDGSGRTAHPHRCADSP